MDCSVKFSPPPSSELEGEFLSNRVTLLESLRCTWTAVLFFYELTLTIHGFRDVGDATDTVENIHELGTIDQKPAVCHQVQISIRN